MFETCLHILSTKDYMCIVLSNSTQYISFSDTLDRLKDVANTHLLQSAIEKHKSKNLD